MHQIAFGGHLRPDPLGELTAIPRPHSWIKEFKGSLLLREEDRKEMEEEDRGGSEGEGSECHGGKGERRREQGRVPPFIDARYAPAVV